MNQLKLAACGIECDGCDLRNAGHDLKAAESCVAWFRAQEWIAADGNAESVQQAVLNKKPYCSGCWSEKSEDQFCANCDLRVCCEKKEINHCGGCDDFPCEKYTAWLGGLEHHIKAMEYLQSM